MATNSRTFIESMLARVTTPLVVVLLCFCLTGCMSKLDRAKLFYAQAGANRTTAAAAMAAAWRKQEIKLDDCLNLAFEHLDNEGDAASIAFAGAVLDFAADIERELPQQGEFMLMWFRIGGLAGDAATKAYNANDFVTARSIVLAGPKKWQSEAYWERHPNHDALAARLMFLNGEQPASLKWLRRHDDMTGPLKDAYDEIIQASRKP